MYAQVDNEGNQYLLLQEITDHRKDNSAIPILEGMIQNSSGTTKPKASNPVEVAEYTVANRFVEEPAFKWWVPHVII